MAPLPSAANQLEKRQDILSPRERQIITLREKGLTVKEIASLLNISYHTVRTHLDRVYAKTKTMSSLAAIYKLRTMRRF